MQHGDHWEAVEKEATPYIDAMLPLIAQEGKVVGENTFSHEIEEMEVKEGVVYGLRYPEPSPVCFIALVVSGINQAYRELWTAYPFCSEGFVQRFTIGNFIAEPDGIEGTVEVYTDETESLIYFDPLFFLNKDRYKEGEAMDVALSALAYRLEKLEDEGSVSEDPIETVWYEVLDGVEDSAHLVLVVEDAVVLACLGRIFWRMTGVIIRGWEDESVEIRINLYASEQVLNGYQPKNGDTVGAIAWIQGWLHTPEPSA